MFTRSLFFVCRDGATCSYPEGASHQTYRSRLPLHVAAVSRSPPKIIEAVLKANPKAVTARACTAIAGTVSMILIQ